MVSSKHEAMHRLFRHDPGAFASAFRAIGLTFPDPIAVEQVCVDLTETAPLERRADSILRITTATDKFLVIVEAQGKVDSSRPGAWTYYLAFVQEKHRVPAILVVLCSDRNTAAWADAGFTIGHHLAPNLTLKPLVLGPANVPAVSDPDIAAANLPLTALSAITHATEPDIGAILDAAAAAVREHGDQDDVQLFIELIDRGLTNTPAAGQWRKLMAIELSFFRGDTAQQLRDEGREEGLATSVLRVLRRRGVVLSTAQELSISSCHDLARLGEWLERAAVADSAEDVFGR
ncbi:hypothetical protein ACFXNW_04490 [Nocardia sp. NPDC059180]|uniref:hypothetical protein n=1 Tax=Nocardia sp. NPDC059180 TaxID=3346761 RepID=UPI0036A0D7AC